MLPVSPPTVLFVKNFFSVGRVLSFLEFAGHVPARWKLTATALRSGDLGDPP